MSKEASFEAVINVVGSQAELARILGLSPSTVCYWSKSGIPAEQALKLEELSGMRFPRWLSRPDLWEPPYNKEGVAE